MNKLGIKDKDITKNIVKIINSRLKLPHYKLFYFGSRVNGMVTERSDIDVGIISDETLHSGAIEDLKDELGKTRIMQIIDLVDFSRVGEDFKRVALKNMEVIYER